MPFLENKIETKVSKSPLNFFGSKKFSRDDVRGSAKRSEAKTPKDKDSDKERAMMLADTQNEEDATANGNADASETPNSARGYPSTRLLLSFLLSVVISHINLLPSPLKSSQPRPSESVLRYILH